MSPLDDSKSVHSVFSDDEGSCSINLSKLRGVVEETLGSRCTLHKLAEGGNHKIYDILLAGENVVKSVVRVPSPDVPVDKLESEVATLQYIAANTSVPVPKVIGWSTDPSRSAGTEYMLLEKIPGDSAYEVWDTLKMEAKETLVRDVSKYLLELFNLRFSHGGSLYSARGTAIEVGPLVTTPFFRALDGKVRFPKSDPLDLSQFRGPFTSVIDQATSSLKAELYVVERRRSELLQGEFKGREALLDLGKIVLQKAVKLVEVYPGELTSGICGSNSTKPFSIKLDDFRLANIMIDGNSGQVLGLIDFEGTTTAPLWMCAGFPYWLENYGDDVDPEVDQSCAHLREIFNDNMKAHGAIGEEWLELSQKGRLFRDFAFMLDYQVQVWAELERWVDERLAFAEKYPGIGMPERSLEEDLEEQSAAAPSNT